MLPPNNETSRVKNTTSEETLPVNITSEETLFVNITSEETSLVNITTCEKLAEMCTYTLPRILEKEQGYDQCQDKRVRENGGFFVANSLVVILVGTFTNLFNLVAFAYIYFAYPGKFPWMSDRRVLLLLHLSLCDLLYCTIGLPPFVSIFSNGFFFGSSSLCSFTAGLRNVIAYADIFTMSAIALTTSLGHIFRNDCAFMRATNTPKATLISCVLIWVLSFLIISPAVFEFSIAKFGFGSFGWDSVMGICEVNKDASVSLFSTVCMCPHQVTSCRNPVGLASGAVIYLIGVTIPFIILLLSHIALEIYFIRKKSPLGTPQTTPKNQTMLVLLSLTYAIFTGVLFPVELGVQIDVFWYLVCYSWYWWMYAVNIFIYIVTDQDFRKVYRHFLTDVYTGCLNGYMEGY